MIQCKYDLEQDSIPSKAPMGVGDGVYMGSLSTMRRNFLSLSHSIKPYQHFASLPYIFRMSMSDINVNTKVFDPELAHASTKALNDYLVQHGDQGPKWWEVSHAIALHR